MQEGRMGLFPNLLSQDPILVVPVIIGSKINFSYEVPTGSHAKLAVYSANGMRLATLANGDKLDGRQEVTWGAFSHGSGMYVFELETGKEKAVQRAVFLKNE